MKCQVNTSVTRNQKSKYSCLNCENANVSAAEWKHQKWRPTTVDVNEFNAGGGPELSCNIFIAAAGADVDEPGLCCASAVTALSMSAIMKKQHRNASRRTLHHWTVTFSAFKFSVTFWAVSVSSHHCWFLPRKLSLLCSSDAFPLEMKKLILIQDTNDPQQIPGLKHLLMKKWKHQRPEKRAGWGYLNCVIYRFTSSWRQKQ